ncbi:unnamed protein product [Brassica oleracea]
MYFLNDVVSDIGVIDSFIIPDVISLYLALIAVEVRAGGDNSDPAMPTVIKAAVYLSCGAGVFYLLGREIKRRANYLSNILRVIELKRLGDYLQGDTTNILVVVSGKVGSAEPLNCKQGLLSVFVEEKAKVHFEIKLESGHLIKRSLNYLLQQKETSWYLEDNTGRVNVVEAESAVGFRDILNKYPLNIPSSEIFKKLVKPEGFKVLKYCCHESALNIGASLTFVGEAVRDKAGNIMIQRPKDLSFLVFGGEGSFNKMVSHRKANAEIYIFFSKVCGTIVVAMAIMYGVHFVRKFLLPFEWEKNKDLRKRSEKTISDSAAVQSMKKKKKKKKRKKKKMKMKMKIKMKMNLQLHFVLLNL